MEAIILTKDQFEQLIAKIDDINDRLTNTNPKRTETYLNNKQFMEMLDVSLRTAQTWRDEGKITFSQVGNKIYYKLSDVEKFIQNYRNAAFAKK
ncbi:helix-turn-helix domain-containing protein [Epilithonimonas hominis]|uniref:DNA-binding protein n=1 Tax=Epilithonimonas hominis TaxID=420404 RepID=A0A1H6L0Y9_9FLAO|nr:helix-turn-helix domain-containing protein [Epilithonimonas hominis]ROI13638.1 DNA-binding protein [Epilithonimonas hominis]SEH79029.1 Helix-turn-helix domain-containing protein [Epilithonimonas hominis]